MSDEFTHFNAKGEAHMVDVGSKAVTQREAVTEGRIYMNPKTLKMIMEGTHKKGDVLGIARVAGIMGAKKTSDLIPLCHPINLTAVELDLTPDPATHSVYCLAKVRCGGQTGVEMEALTAVSVAALTVYDMAKAAEKTMRIQNIRLVEKHGGQSGDVVNE